MKCLVLFRSWTLGKHLAKMLFISFQLTIHTQLWGPFFHPINLRRKEQTSCFQESKETKGDLRELSGSQGLISLPVVVHSELFQRHNIKHGVPVPGRSMPVCNLGLPEQFLLCCQAYARAWGYFAFWQNKTKIDSDKIQIQRTK